MSVNNLIANNVRNNRILKGLSQENVANELDMSSEGYGKIERGETKLKIDTLESLAKIFGMKPEDILNFKSESFFQDQSTYNNQNGDNNHFSLESEHVKSLKEEIKFLKEEIIFFRSKLKGNN
jgi:transcriptional regulator with XRE-family HTH domain